MASLGSLQVNVEDVATQVSELKAGDLVLLGPRSKGHRYERSDRTLRTGLLALLLVALKLLETSQKKIQDYFLDKNSKILHLN